MLLKHRPPGIDPTSVPPRTGFEHLEPKSLAVLRWLNANKIDYVLVGPVARAIRGETTAKGAVAVVPAPYRRNHERLTRALAAQHAGLRSERGLPGGSDRAETVSVKLTAEKLARGRRWMFRFGDYDLDVERAGGSGGPGVTGTADPAAAGEGVAGVKYQELLYESNRFELAEGLSVEVAAPEDLEHYSHVRRTGSAPEFRVTRNPAPLPGEADRPADTARPTGISDSEA